MKMKAKKTFIILTAIGMLGATAAAGAAGLTEKVSGLLRSDIKITVNGEPSTLQPVYIDGKAYVPIRDTAGLLGYEVQASGKQIQLTSAASQEEQPGEDEAMRPIELSGVVVGKTEVDGTVKLEIRGNGGSDWMVLSLTKDTEIVDESGVTKTAKDIAVGTHVDTLYGPISTMSYPGGSAAVKVVVGQQRLIKEDTISQVKKSEYGWQVHLGSLEELHNVLVMNLNEQTMIVRADGEQVKPEELKEGTQVKAYYGPATTRSMPPQATVELIVVQP